MSKTTYQCLKLGFFVAAFAMIAYLSQGVSSFLLFSSLLLVVTLGRSVPLVASCAVLLGACFPILGVTVAVLIFLYLVFHPASKNNVRPT
ncbi:hypothetical protein JST97_17385 [bacterium]|nr:hypothetical protein [bacterium]